MTRRSSSALCRNVHSCGCSAHVISGEAHDPQHLHPHTPDLDPGNACLLQFFCYFPRLRRQVEGSPRLPDNHAIARVVHYILSRGICLKGKIVPAIDRVTTGTRYIETRIAPVRLGPDQCMGLAASVATKGQCQSCAHNSEFVLRPACSHAPWRRASGHKLGNTARSHILTIMGGVRISEGQSISILTCIAVIGSLSAVDMPSGAALWSALKPCPRN